MRSRSRTLLVDWRGKNLEKAVSADVFARVAGLRTTAGSLVVLAFEISPTRSLPYYSYFPFDLNNRAHRNYLERLTEMGEIRLCFLAGDKTLDRSHQLGEFLRSHAAEMYAGILQERESSGRNEGYSFEGAVQVLERFVRIPELLEHAVSERDFARVREHISKVVQDVSSENREYAHRVIRELVTAFQPDYAKNEKSVSEKALLIRRGLLYLDDMRRLFARDQEGFVLFLGDAIAVSLPKSEVTNLQMWGAVGAHLLQMASGQNIATQPNQMTTIPSPPFGLNGILQNMKDRGISGNSLIQLAETLGITVGAKPGRSIEDYSREYELKARLSWREVARKRLEDDPELRAEFGGRSYDELEFETKGRVVNRIREGVRQYAIRNGKPFPVPRETAVQGNQKIE